MTNDILREVINENEELKAENYNLTLYLSELAVSYVDILSERTGMDPCKVYGFLSKVMNEYFNGMPGYVPQRYGLEPGTWSKSMHEKIY